WIPTWRFFDAQGSNAELWVREAGEWRRGFEPPRRPWYLIFFNPRWSEFHARENLLERLVAEIGEGRDPETLVSYRLVERLAGGRAFKIVAQGQDVLVKS